MYKGLLYVVFGEQYDSLAAHTIVQSRQNTELPICVLTNSLNRCSKWKEVSNVHYIYIDKKQNENRDVKTHMLCYTPFDETIYLDCDSVIRNKGIEQAFDLLQNNDLVLNKFLRWGMEDKILRLYRRVMRREEVKLPLEVYNGAFIGFKKNTNVASFFSMWNSFWIRDGKGREMPSLACALKKSDSKIFCLPKGFFCPDIYDKNCIVQHNYNSNAGMDFHQEFSLPRIRENKPFDNDASDWNWVGMDK